MVNVFRTSLYFFLNCYSPKLHYLEVTLSKQCYTISKFSLKQLRFTSNGDQDLIRNESVKACPVLSRRVCLELMVLVIWLLMIWWACTEFSRSTCITWIHLVNEYTKLSHIRHLLWIEEFLPVSTVTVWTGFAVYRITLLVSFSWWAINID